MVYKRGRFVIHYKDGDTYMEDRNDPHSWDNRPRKPISAVGIQPDSNILINQFIRDPKTGKETKREVPINLESTDPNHRFVLNEMVLKGSWKYDYGFFMDKHKDEQIKRFGKSRGQPLQSNVWGIRFGMVVNKYGHCVCMEYVGTGGPRMYYTTVHALGMDQNSLVKNFGINLEELPNPAKFSVRYPEINPKRIEERKERELERKKKANAVKTKPVLKKKKLEEQLDGNIK